MITQGVVGEANGAPTFLERPGLVCSDIANSSGLVAEAGDLAVRGAVREFFRRAEQLQAAHHGRTVKTFGDGFLAVFVDVADALAFAGSLQQSLSRDPIAVAGQRVAARASVHTGPIQLRQTSYGEDVFGDDVNLVARLTDLARPGEVVVSGAARLALSEELRALLGPSQRQTVPGAADPVEVSRLNLAGA